MKVGHTGQKTAHVVENIMQGIEKIVQHIPHKWNNIQSVHIKTADSIALPVFNSLPLAEPLLPIESKKGKKAEKAASSAQAEKKEEEAGEEKKPKQGKAAKAPASKASGAKAAPAAAAPATKKRAAAATAQKPTKKQRT